MRIGNKATFVIVIVLLIPILSKGQKSRVKPTSKLNRPLLF